MDSQAYQERRMCIAPPPLITKSTIRRLLAWVQGVEASGGGLLQGRHLEPAGQPERRRGPGGGGAAARPGSRRGRGRSGTWPPAGRAGGCRAEMDARRLARLVACDCKKQRHSVLQDSPASVDLIFQEALSTPLGSNSGFRIAGLAHDVVCTGSEDSR